MKRLGYVVNCTQGKSQLLMFDIGKAGNQYHRNTLGYNFFLQFFQQRKAIHPRHNHVQKNQGKFP